MTTPKEINELIVFWGRYGELSGWWVSRTITALQAMRGDGMVSVPPLEDAIYDILCDVDWPDNWWKDGTTSEGFQAKRIAEMIAALQVMKSDGMVSVPVEPTDKEFDLLFEAYNKQYHGGDEMTDVCERIRALRRIMIAAAREK